MPSSEPHPAPLLIALPKGAGLSGITTWAFRLADGLTRRGRRVMVLIHETPSALGAGAFERLEGSALLDIRVVSGMPPIDDPAPDPRPELPQYVRAVEELHQETGRRVVAIPTCSAECAGLLAAVSRLRPGAIAPIGWMHNDIPYDRRTLEHFEPLLHRFVGVSTAIVESLRTAGTLRERDIRLIPYGVPVPAALHQRLYSRIGTAARPLRLVYAGRMDREQKRVHALVEMSRILRSRGVAHELVLVGEGPSAGMIDALIAGSATIRRVRHAVSEGPDRVEKHLEDADVFVLASRYEGLSLAMLEAMARGCVPVVTRVSGAVDAVEPPGEAVGGVVVDAPACVEEPAVGPALAAGVQRALETGLAGLSEVSHRRARERFNEDRMCAAAAALADEAASEAPRIWPADRPTVAGDFTVPADAAERASRAFAGLAGRTVALWGAGRHTQSVAAAAEGSSARVVVVLDDHADGSSRRLGPWPIVPASELVATGVTDVVISSAMHEPMMWARRAELERLGMRVHRLYAA